MGPGLPEIIPRQQDLRNFGLNVSIFHSQKIFTQFLFLFATLPPERERS